MIKEQKYTVSELLRIIDKDLVIESLVANYENYISELKAGREAERLFRQEQYNILLKGTREKSSAFSYVINKEIKVVFTGDTGRKVYIGGEKVYDGYCPPTSKELTEVFNVHGINDDIESLHQFIVNGSIYLGSLEVSTSYEGNCVLD